MLPIFVINLLRSVERRRQIEHRLAALGLTYEIVPACDGGSLPPAQADAASASLPHLGRPLSRDEIGCLQSHIALWSRIVRDRLPLACVLEDDCVLSADFATIVRGLEAPTSGWDLLLLGHHSSRHGADAGAETCFGGTRVGARRIARVAEFPMGAYAYVATTDAARALARYASPLRMPADWVTGYSPAAGLRLCAVTPPCVTPLSHSAAPTTIAGRELTAWAPRPRGFGRLLRDAGGRAWLWLRKLGIRPDGYVKRF